MTADEQSMRRALELARKGIGLVSPNPAVGAVVVDGGGNEVGSGTHTYEGIKHAEILALEQAGNRARGGTLYLNLEPCSHQGRTGPCADAIVAVGIKRIVCSMEDPNPKVAGQGFERLRTAGVQVDVGVIIAGQLQIGAQTTDVSLELSERSNPHGNYRKTSQFF